MPSAQVDSKFAPQNIRQNTKAVLRIPHKRLGYLTSLIEANADNCPAISRYPPRGASQTAVFSSSEKLENTILPSKSSVRFSTATLSSPSGAYGNRTVVGYVPQMHKKAGRRVFKFDYAVLFGPSKQGPSASNGGDPQNNASIC